MIPSCQYALPPKTVPLIIRKIKYQSILLKIAPHRESEQYRSLLKYQALAMA